MQKEEMLKVLVMKVTKNLQKELFIHVIFQPEEVLLLCETLDLLQGTGSVSYTHLTLPTILLV